MNKDFVEMMKQLSTMDVASSPNYRTAMAIATHEKAIFQNKPKVAFSMQINVNDNFVNDPDFDAVIEYYVILLNNFYKRLRIDFSDEDADGIFLKVSSSMTLEYTY